MPIERRVIADRAEWLTWRRDNVNASEAPAVLDAHPYKTKMRLWAEKRGVEFAPEADNKAMKRGRWFEPAVARAVADIRPEWTLTAGDSYFVDVDRRIGATPDYFIKDMDRGRGVLQCKTAARHVYERDWDGGEQCARFAMFQCFMEIGMTDADFGAVAVLLVDGYDVDCRVFDVPRHDEAWQKLQEDIAKFWEDVDAGREPAPDYARDSQTVAALAPRGIAGKTIDLRANNELPRKLAYRADLIEQIEDLKISRESIEAEIKHLFGDAEIATGINDWTVTYKTSNRAGYYVDPKENIRTLRITDRRNRERQSA